jgi:PAS domain S-box-containing protein
MHENRSSPVLQWCIRFAAAAALSIGFGWLLLWLLGAAPRWSASGAITVKTNMALCQLFGGAALLLLWPAEIDRRRRWAGAAAASVVFLVGALTLGEHVFGLDLGMDQLIATEAPGAAATTSPNRMGPSGSTSLALIGAGLIFLAWRRRSFVPYLGTAACLINLVPAVGFLYGIGPFYNEPHLTGIAWPTVVAMLSLGSGLVLSRLEDGPVAALFHVGPGGALLRRLLPAALLAPLALGYLTVQWERWGLYGTAMGTGLLVISLILVFTSLLWQSVKQLNRAAASQSEAERSLRRSEELYRAIARNLPESCVWVLDREGRFLVAEGPLMVRLGLSTSKFEGRGIQEAVEEPLRKVLEEGRRRALGGTPSSCEVDCRGRTVNARQVPLPDENGLAAETITMLRDVTERVRAEKALKKSVDELELRVSERTAELQAAHQTLVKQSRYLEAFFRYAATPMAFLERDFNFIRVNEAYAKACRREVEEFPGRNYFELYPLEARTIFEDVVRTKRPFQASARSFVFPDHPERGVTYWDWTLTPLLDDRCEVEILVFSLEDVTSRTRTEFELAKHREHLEELVKDRTRELEAVNARLEAEIAVRERAEQDLQDSHSRAVWMARFPEENPSPVLRASADGLVLYRNPATAELPEWRCEVGEHLPGPLGPLVGRAMAQELEIKQDIKLWNKSYSVSIVSFPRERYANIYALDITERALAEEKVRRQNKVLDAINQIFQKALDCETEGELGAMCLSALEELTGSATSFIGEVGPDGSFHEFAISDTGREQCALRDKAGHRMPPGDFEIRGLYGRVLRDGRSLLTNEPDSIGAPEGHPALKALLGVPLIKDSKTIGMIAVANREGGYTVEQQRDLEAAAPAILQALLRKKAEEALLKAKDELEQRVRERTAELSKAIDKLAAEITERRKAEEAVQAEQRRLNDVMDMLPVYVALLTPDHRMSFANRFFKERFGEPDGRRCFEFLFELTEPCKTCETYRVLETGRTHQWDWTGPDGRYYRILDFPFTDVDGFPLIMEVGTDITERKRAEAELAAMIGSLKEEVRQRQFAEEHLKTLNEQLNSRVSQVRALVSELTQVERSERRRMAKVLHDHLQQLLVSAKLRLSVLCRGADDLVKKGAREIEGLLDESISASQSLTAELSPPILHVGSLKDCFEWLAQSMDEKYGLKVKLAADEGIPALTDDLKAFLFESVRELLFNSVKHAHVSSATLDLRRPEPTLLRISVGDKGRGFDPASLKPVGETGGGFGLFTMRERLDLIGGTMSIESSSGRGSLFVLTVPFIPASVSEPSPAVPLSAPGRRARAGTSATGARIRVMLVDDHAVVREGLTRLLSQEPDIEIVGEAADGREAVEIADAVRPDVILMDKSMPRLDGVGATRLLHDRFPDVRIIGLSMFEKAESAEDMRDAGAVAYLIKSGPIDAVVAAIRAARTSPSPAPGPPVRRKGGGRGRGPTK